MYTEKCDIDGKRGIKRVREHGDYVVIANRELHRQGESSRFALVNERQKAVDSVHPSPTEAFTTAKGMTGG
ncbi:MAG: hypothetical protein ACLFWD_10060 [Anaerolineales bacterium]